ncbi:hypothetical protein ACOGYQ_001748 [Edwardsiella piscicida]|uniref:hypothetical protein n=1 Tax=Edwardsiella piscicida TaxID=1263550 RepID=UPI00084C08F1|nr:hypothetical protein [Edwardsiella piscicida]AOP41954.1 hypothetical protein A9797_02235 [Edwardsiella piscicida]EKS7766749.1 hypothetical protein [Edwardsiella piscicida]UCQ31706.1 hypothetical protein DCF74_02295 [Edwardsiella piscicida]UCQ58034.1 hypothetical protein DCF40_02285 [Edwardsiella piscicida]
MDIEDKDYQQTLLALEKRAKSTKYVTLSFVYIMFLSMILVIGGVVSMKANSDNAVSRFITGILDKDKIESAKLINDNVQKIIDQLRASKTNEPIRNGENKIRGNPLHVGEFIYSKKDTSEKIADSVTSIIVSFSILIFIGYVMRVAIVFIKYHMQLGTDYENQKIAFLLSKGQPEEFRTNLETLRNNTIGFDKTPLPPQEKIIMGLIEAIGTVRQKTKGEN